MLACPIPSSPVRYSSPLLCRRDDSHELRGTRLLHLLLYFTASI